MISVALIGDREIWFKFCEIGEQGLALNMRLTYLMEPFGNKALLVVGQLQSFYFKDELPSMKG